MPRKLTVAQVQRIRRLVAGGASCSKVARRMGLDHRTVYNIATGVSWGALGPPVLARRTFRKRHWATKYGPEVARKVLALRAKGMDYKEITRALGMPLSAFQIVRQIILGTHWTVRGDPNRSVRPSRWPSRAPTPEPPRPSRSARPSARR